MTRRLFYVAFGATVGILAVRQLRRAAEAMGPSTVAGSLAERARVFAAEVRAGMAERETELRAELGLDGSADTIDAHTMS